jgi:hypothetical protein
MRAFTSLPSCKDELRESVLVGRREAARVTATSRSLDRVSRGSCWWGRMRPAWWSAAAADGASARAEQATVLSGEVLADINQVREAHGLVLHKASAPLAAAATAHSTEMGEDGDFAHPSMPPNFAHTSDGCRARVYQIEPGCATLRVALDSSDLRDRFGSEHRTPR